MKAALVAAVAATLLVSACGGESTGAGASSSPTASASRPASSAPSTASASASPKATEAASPAASTEDQRICAAIDREQATALGGFGSESADAWDRFGDFLTDLDTAGASDDINQKVKGLAFGLSLAAIGMLNGGDVTTAIEEDALSYITDLQAACSQAGWPLDQAASVTAASESGTQLEGAVAMCGLEDDRFIEIGDGGYTLLIDGAPEGRPKRGASIESIGCLAAVLDISDSVIARIDSTRALDGRQEGDWGSFTASWTYHPDDGLDMIIEESG